MAGDASYQAFKLTRTILQTPSMRHLQRLLPAVVFAAATTLAQGAEEVLYRLNCGHNGFVADANGDMWTGDATMTPGGATVKASRWTDVNYALTPETEPYASLFEVERCVTVTVTPLKSLQFARMHRASRHSSALRSHCPTSSANSHTAHLAFANSSCLQVWKPTHVHVCGRL